MKILISGHSRGIGKAVADYFAAKNYQVSGYSRSNNRDMSQFEIKNQFVAESMQSDIIVINAYNGFSTVNTFYDVCRICKGKTDKTIVVIGSHSTETTKTFMHPYQIEKLALEEAARQMQNVPGYPTIVIVRPGWVDTDMIAHINPKHKMTSQSVAELIGQILDLNSTQDYKILNILIVPK